MLLGFEAAVSLDDGLARTADWHRAVRAGGVAVEA